MSCRCAFYHPSLSSDPVQRRYPSCKRASIFSAPTTPFTWPSKSPLPFPVSAQVSAPAIWPTLRNAESNGAAECSPRRRRKATPAAQRTCRMRKVAFAHRTQRPKFILARKRFPRAKTISRPASARPASFSRQNGVCAGKDSASRRYFLRCDRWISVSYCNGKGMWNSLLLRLDGGVTPRLGCCVLCLFDLWYRVEYNALVLLYIHTYISFGVSRRDSIVQCNLRRRPRHSVAIRRLRHGRV